MFFLHQYENTSFMAFLSVNIFSFLLITISLLPKTHSLSTVAISETGNQTLVCAITQSLNNTQRSFLNCTSFPQRNQIQLNTPFESVSGIVGGNGFLCALHSFYSSSTSVIVCWRVSNIGINMNYRRIYHGPILTEIESGNSHICGVANGSNSPQCWQWQNFNTTSNIFTSNLAVGEDFVCGLSNSSRVRCSGSYTNVVDNVSRGEFGLIAAGFREACGVLFNGSLECWGNVTGERPRGMFKALALGENCGCAIRPIGTVICWGENGFSLPESFRNVSFIEIKAKRRIFCGVTTVNYTLLCWGNDDLNSDPLAIEVVVPGPCRARNECLGNLLPNYSRYCTNGLVVCMPGVNLIIQESLPPPPSSIPPLAPLPPFSNGGRSRKWNSRMLAFLVVGCAGSFSLLLVLCIFVFSRYFKVRGSRIHDSGRLEEGGGACQQSGQMSQPRPDPPALEKKLSHMISMGNGGLEEFSFQVLLEITNNFSEDHKIGIGSFGSVYYAKLEDGREVAIKRAEISSYQSYAGNTKRGQEDKDSAFLNELEFLSRLNHKNLVRLFGYCEDCNERVLVYEYMNNGTLYDHLHKLDTTPLMSWVTRIKVALDAARGIEYLHEFAVPRIIHRDIKTSNILLDATWTARVSDFGLSLTGPGDDEAHLSLHAAGTMGYMDPEYYRSRVLTTKSDVYSFGILLLELLSGNKAIHMNENGVPRNVVDYAVPYIIQDEVHRVLDRRVPPPTPFEIEAVGYVGYLAADCVMPEGINRPTMSEVVSSLDNALEACLAPNVLSRSTTDSST